MTLCKENILVIPFHHYIQGNILTTSCLLYYIRDVLNSKACEGCVLVGGMDGWRVEGGGLHQHVEAHSTTLHTHTWEEARNIWTFDKPVYSSALTYLLLLALEFTFFFLVVSIISNVFIFLGFLFYIFFLYTYIELSI